MSGREVVPNRRRLDALFRGDAFTAGLGIELEDWGGGTATVTYVPVADHRNFVGVAHGASVFAVGDAAFAVASNSWGRCAVALSVDAHFLAAPSIGRPLRAVGRERSRTRRTGSYQIDVTDGDRPIASLHAMVYRLDSWHLGADAWPEDWRAEH